MPADTVASLTAITTLISRSPAHSLASDYPAWLSAVGTHQHTITRTHQHTQHPCMHECVHAGSVEKRSLAKRSSGEPYCQHSPPAPLLHPNGYSHTHTRQHLSVVCVSFCWIACLIMIKIMPALSYCNFLSCSSLLPTHNWLLSPSLPFVQGPVGELAKCRLHRQTITKLMHRLSSK